jgi:hypothetical protein
VLITIDEPRLRGLRRLSCAGAKRTLPGSRVVVWKLGSHASPVHQLGVVLEGLVAAREGEALGAQRASGGCLVDNLCRPRYAGARSVWQGSKMRAGRAVRRVGTRRGVEQGTTGGGSNAYGFKA